MDGKVDWMAYGLPVEGTDGPFLGDIVEAVPTCDVTLSVPEARERLEASGADTAVIVAGGGLAVGEVDRSTLDGTADDARLLDLMRPVPTTVRPSVTVASVAQAGGGTRLVTTSDGRLLGTTTVDAADHDDHQGHDHDGPPLDLGRYEHELAEVMQDVQERFGDREPSAQELRDLLRDRLVAEGRTADDADRYLDDLGIGDLGIGDLGIGGPGTGDAGIGDAGIGDAN